MFPNHNSMKLEINSRRRNWVTHKYMEIITFLNSQWIKEEIKRGIRKYFEMDEN